MFLMILKWVGGIVVSLIIILAVLVWILTFHPAPVENVPVVSPSDAPVLKNGQELKVLSWNVQYMAGKNYIFYYDTKDFDGPDDRPSSEDITKTFGEVARIIKDENPDIILLQEVDDGAKRTDYEDQLARLLSMLPDDYKCYSSTFYWKAKYVPHPRIRGAVGVKLVVISKYAMRSATRYQMPLIPSDPITQQFNLKRAVLEVHMPLSNGAELVVLDTHLDGFAQGTDAMEKQISKVDEILRQIDREGLPWILGGDFNLLPPGNCYKLLADDQKYAFNPETEIAPLFSKYQVIPTFEETNGPEAEKWFTYLGNDSKTGKPDRTIDYIFYSDKIKPVEHRVRHFDTMNISDHFPLIFKVVLP
jgi:endonuclease/exonuclease/phosphatase family metal-dependent hydrolase